MQDSTTIEFDLEDIDGVEPTTPNTDTTDANQIVTDVLDNLDDSTTSDDNDITNNVVTDDTTDDTTDEIPFYVQTLENSGLEFDDEELKLFEGKEDSPDTLKEVVNFIVNKQLNSQRQELLSEYPDLEQAYYSLKTGKTFEDFMQTKTKQVDFSKLNLDKDSIYEQREVAREYLKLKNVEKEVADQMIKTQEESGKLYDFAKQAHEQVKKHYNTTSQKSKEEYQQLQAQQLAQYEKEITNAKDLANKGVLAGISIPKADANTLVDYVYKANDKGLTGYAADAQNLTQDQILAIAYLVKNKFDFSKVLTKQIQTEKVKSIKDYFKSSKPGSRTHSASNRKGPNSFSFDDLELSSAK